MARLVELPKVPDPRPVASSVIGYRSWSYQSRTDGGSALVGAYGTHWEHPQQKASCAKHPAPDWNCQCGIYAYQPSLLETWNLDPRSCGVWGQVVMWGRIIVAERGVRAQHARILRLLYTAPDKRSADEFIFWTRDWDCERAVLCNALPGDAQAARLWLRQGENAEGRYLVL